MAKKKVINKVGRPTIYTDELAIEICERYSTGELLDDICNDKHMPTTSTIYDWIDKTSPRFIEKFSELWLRAKVKCGNSHIEKSMNTLNKSLLELKDYDPAIANAFVNLIKHKSNCHMKIAGYVNRNYNDNLILLQAKQESETKQTEADIEI